jgi:Flp pilus assembly protein TadG
MDTHGRVTGQRRGRGAAAVEFALVLPLLCLLLFGIVSYGYMLSFRQAISQASAEGARAAAVAPSATSTTDRLARAEQAVNSGLGTYGVSCSGGALRRSGQTVGTCSISAPQACTASAVAGSRCVKVTLNYQYRSHSLLPSFPGLGVVLPDNLNYGSEAEVS